MGCGGLADITAHGLSHVDRLDGNQPASIGAGLDALLAPSWLDHGTAHALWSVGTALRHWSPSPWNPDEPHRRSTDSTDRKPSGSAEWSSGPK
ncbi:hypothetical protein BP5796_08769 [Coleophoma crateriformis]|uniref:Uncharacterized protein n=1 Tax=Coleophoma crateriformis TaxID=565419 RepID=A0A3D8R8K2_9HELO|nr:hypothetical protein BP5796_08769 [Coleophoma crateriformis]